MRARSFSPAAIPALLFAGVALSCTVHFPSDDTIKYACANDADCDGHGWKCVLPAGHAGFCCLPEPEKCDGKDNDCDGVIDNMEPWDCYDGPEGTEGVGTCHVGSQQCVSGGPGPCLGEVTPSTDFCNGLDDDCDGKTDEDFDLKTDPKHCGACSIFCRADQQCINGLCSKGQENCTDGIDNDKNGLTDCADPACLGQLCKPEPFAFTCGADLKCTCDGVAYPLPESDCSNHADDDCDGLADCADTADCEGKTCGSGCKCTAGLPAEVDCGNHIDDDRDGKTDCADPDCDNKECNDMQHGCACVGGLYTETNCADGIDNDGDHVKDCLDPDCDGKPCRLKVDGGMADGTCQSLACR